MRDNSSRSAAVSVTPTVGTAPPLEAGSPQGWRSCLWWCLVACLLSAQVAVGLFTYLVPEFDQFLHYLDYHEPHSNQSWILTNWVRTKYGSWMRQIVALFALFARVAFQWFKMKGYDQWDSIFAAEASQYIMVTWAANIVQAARLTVLWYLPCAHCSILGSFEFKVLVKYLVDIQYVLTTYYFYCVLEHRVRFVEVGWGASLGCKWLAITRNVGLILQIVLFTIGDLNLDALASNGHFWAAVNAAQAWSPIAAMCITLWAMTQVLRPVMKPVPFARGVVQAEQAWARRYLTLFRVVLVTPLAVNGLGFLLKAVVFNVERIFNEASMLLDALASLFSLLAEATALLIILNDGIGQQAIVQTDASEGEPTPHIVNPHDGSTSDTWVDKVSALAGRGMSVSALLDFYERLGPGGDVMPHFSPRLSTTADVVRQAIIPLSRIGDRGVAYAELVRTESQGLPSRMVTHAWGCLFGALVATVVADAIDVDESGGVLAALEAGRLLELRDQVDASGSSARLYWLCSFCVNQHAGICGGFGPPPRRNSSACMSWDRGRRDTVTKQIYPLCSCKEPKHFSDHPEECEMNKFDDMMAELSARVPDLQQLVAVDPDLTIFDRAWCVAELVQSSVSRIPQTVKLLSRQGIDLYSNDMTIYKKLARLTVTNCKASRKEDKEAIMSRI